MFCDRFHDADPVRCKVTFQYIKEHAGAKTDRVYEELDRMTEFLYYILGVAYGEYGMFAAVPGGPDRSLAAKFIACMVDRLIAGSADDGLSVEERIAFLCTILKYQEAHTNYWFTFNQARILTFVDGQEAFLSNNRWLKDFWESVCPSRPRRVVKPKK